MPTLPPASDVMSYSVHNLFKYFWRLKSGGNLNNPPNYELWPIITNRLAAYASGYTSHSINISSRHNLLLHQLPVLSSLISPLVVYQLPFYTSIKLWPNCFSHPSYNFNSQRLKEKPLPWIHSIINICKKIWTKMSEKLTDSLSTGRLLYSAE